MQTALGSGGKNMFCPFELKQEYGFPLSYSLCKVVHCVIIFSLGWYVICLHSLGLQALRVKSQSVIKVI